jgi:hypothetical protein
MMQGKYKYGYLNNFVRIFSYISIAACILTGIFFLVVGILTVDIAKNGFTLFVRSLLYFTFYTVLSPIALLFIIYRFSDIVVDDQGLRIKVLTREHIVGWIDILEVKPISPFGLFTRHNVSVVVTNSRLPFLHRIYGLIYGGTTCPSVLIGKSISSYSELMKIISARMKKNARNQNTIP